MKVPVSMSNRHIHLSKEDSDILFWKDHTFMILKELSQPWQFACEEVVSIKWPRWQIEKIRILWPYRGQTQVEILMWDNYKLWIKAPIRMSWDLKDSEWIEIIWPKWSIKIEEWVIVAQRHIHMNIEDAKHYNVKDWDIVSVKIEWERWLTLDNVIIRANKSYALDMHIDSEEWNAAWLIKHWTMCEIIK